MKLILKIVLLWLLPFFLQAQQQKQLDSQTKKVIIFSENKKIDTLKNQLKLAKNDTIRITILENIGLLYDKVNIDSSLKYGLAALELARLGGNVSREARALAGLSGVLREQGKFADALDVLFKALKMAEENNIPREIARCHRRLGSVYRELENYPKALEYCSKALKEDKAINNSNGAILDHMDLGHIYERLDQLDSALIHAESAFNQMDGNNNFRPILLMILGNIYFKKGNYPLASSFYHDGLEICLESNDFGTASRICRDLAQLSIQLNQNDSAFYYASIGFESGQKSSYKKGIMHNGIILAKLTEDKQPRVALQYYKMAYAAKDSLFGPDNIETLQNLVSREEARQMELEVAKISYHNNLRWYGVLVGLGALSIFAFILYRNNRQKQKANILLHQQKEEIQSTLTQLKSTQAQLIQSEKMASLGELTAGIAHEIQNPLNFVNNFSEINTDLLNELKGQRLRAKGERDEQVETEILYDIEGNEKKIVHHGKRADAIVKGMLQHSRAGKGEAEATDLNALADEYLRIGYHGFRAKDKSFNALLETDFDPDLHKISIVPQDIGRVILNLLSNAFDAVKEKKRQLPDHYEPTILLSTKKEGDQVLIRVKDNGQGIPEALRDKIFQPFFTTKPSGQGTGLGLSLAYDIVKAHKGKLWVESLEGEYSEFILQLPLKH